MGVGAFRPHFNHAVGGYVTSSREFDNLLKLKAEQAGTTYTRVDPGDVPQPTHDTEVLDTQAKTIHDKRINPKDLV